MRTIEEATFQGENEIWEISSRAEMAYYHRNNRQKYNLKICLGLLVFVLLSVSAMLCVLIGITHCSGLFDPACADTNGLMVIGFWSIILFIVTFFTVWLIQERFDKPRGSLKNPNIQEFILQKVNVLSRFFVRNAFANRFLILTFCLLVVLYCWQAVVPVLPLSYQKEKHMSLSIANTLFLAIYISSTVLITVYNSYRLNKLHVTETERRKSKRSRSVPSFSQAVAVPHDPKRLSPNSEHLDPLGHSDSVKGRPTTTDLPAAESNSQATSGVGSSSSTTIMSSREDVLFPGR